MKRPLCYVGATPLVEAAQYWERTLPEVELCLLPGVASGEPWPEERAGEVEIFFCTHPPPNLDAFRNLRWLQIDSSGFNHLFPFRFAERGITVTNARGVFDCAIAEWNLAMMVNLARDLRTLIRNQEQRTWDRSARFCGELRGRAVGIWGYGGIGRETARLAKALGMRVHVLNRSGKSSRTDRVVIDGTGDPDGSLPDRYFRKEESEAFLRALDFLILAMPLTAETEGLVGERELRSLPKGACLLNPARGQIIQEEALLGVLRDGHLGGAALDTHYRYPLPPEDALWSFPHVIITPHISGTIFSPHFPENMLNVFRQNVQRYIAGRPLLNIVAPADLR